MPFQVHTVMQQPEHINHFLPLNVADTEHKEVSALAPISSHMERMDIVANFGALLHPDDSGAGIQRF